MVIDELDVRTSHTNLVARRPSPLPSTPAPRLLFTLHPFYKKGKRGWYAWDEETPTEGAANMTWLRSARVSVLAFSERKCLHLVIHPVPNPGAPFLSLQFPERLPYSLALRNLRFVAVGVS
ncbi:hypothetical protein FA13DRAFT_242762 [Coprinellus micaceus]|uniref:Uncharacterized protein n=1 Tax=Coprinellus micaceus TaxID=71717 RepID=A0A4Y7SEU7_COPMI|nr:hypothetical protein FA13DRAFT_242762 [Coprinellus micaceus]